LEFWVLLTEPNNSRRKRICRKFWKRGRGRKVERRGQRLGRGGEGEEGK
jgi:hypothetical protein